MYSAANDPETANDSRPQMILKLDRKWSQNRNWPPQRTKNDPQLGPQMIPLKKRRNGVEFQW